MAQVLAGSVLLASFLAGVVALLAPCCVSVMLPAYLSTVFRRRAGVVAGTGVFALGVATVIVPIGLGASALAAAFQRYHLGLFVVGGLAMIAGGAAVVAGWSPKLPMPGGRSPSGGGVGGVYALGVFSGVASACCAPVLVGVTVLAGASGSFPAALTVSATYVLGMVAPLLAMSLVWERYGQRAAGWLHRRPITLPLGRWRPSVALGAALSGALLIAMGALTIALAVTEPAMPTDGWQVRFGADLQHLAATVVTWFDWLPGWVVAALLIAAVAGLVAFARRRRVPQPAAPAQSPAPPSPAADDPYVAATSKDGVPS